MATSGGIEAAHQEIERVGAPEGVVGAVEDDRVRGERPGHHLVEGARLPGAARRERPTVRGRRPWRRAARRRTSGENLWSGSVRSTSGGRRPARPPRRRDGGSSRRRSCCRRPGRTRRRAGPSVCPERERRRGRERRSRRRAAERPRAARATSTGRPAASQWSAAACSRSATAPTRRRARRPRARRDRARRRPRGA